MRPHGEIEAAVCEAVVRFEQDYMGRGPQAIRTDLINDLWSYILRAFCQSPSNTWSNQILPTRGSHTPTSGSSPVSSSGCGVAAV